MREPAILSRHALAALPLAALIAAPAATVPALPAADDAALLDLGRRWEAALQAERAHSATWSDTLIGAAAEAHEAMGYELHEAVSSLFERVVTTAAATPAGLAVKARVLAYENEVENLDDAYRGGSAPRALLRRLRGPVARRRHPPAGEVRDMSAVILAFPRSSPIRALCRAGDGSAPFSPAWCSQHLPLIEAAMDLLAADDAAFARRCRLIKDQDGRAMLDELAGQLDRLGTHMVDVADALSLTAARIRDARACLLR